ncbi:IS4 family transposase [Nostoc cycadae]|uniref:Transposase n=1 Tax=Nostoc cycadae WK-1 TaxID=1861711 RepID=A0A2H6LIW8_9NOSO|nr:IS4 family transposase [Nostoc cycadae]GBE91957.1 transposase [Nostoc cycadae WK-1]GBE93157.1 transposase [Nostoc cycadae WK-1]GBE93571.1 transposase [Nostoc cycadae WK-1]
MLASFYQNFLEKYLNKAQLITLKMLVWLLQNQKQVRIERLAATLPLPIQQNSRRRHLQRFLTLNALSVVLLWFPIIEAIINQHFKQGSQLTIAMDRTQWKENNVLMVSVIYQKRAWPIYWCLLEKEGSSNLEEQQKVLRPVIRLLKKYKLVIIGDREFHSVELAQWLHKQNLSFVFRQKKDTTFREKRQKFQPLSNIEIYPGVHQFYTNVKVTQKQGFGCFNLAVYWKRKYRGKQDKEAWYLLTNLPDFNTALKIYAQRFGIEAMFKDCKTGGYNLESSQASPDRLVRLIFLIALAMTSAWIQGQKIKLQRQQSYVCRSQEQGKTEKRHSNFWIGLYGFNWIVAWQGCQAWVEALVGLIRNKRAYYQRGLKAIKLIQQAL